MPTLAYALEQTTGTPPNWLPRHGVLALWALGLAALDEPGIAGTIEDLDGLLHSVDRAGQALRSGLGELPVAVADCLALFEPYASATPHLQQRVSDSALLLVGDQAAHWLIPSAVAALSEAIDRWSGTEAPPAACR